jgi:hypothetical protein
MTGRRFNESHRIVYDLVSGAMKRLCAERRSFFELVLHERKNRRGSHVQEIQTGARKSLGRRSPSNRKHEPASQLETGPRQADRENDETD